MGRKMNLNVLIVMITITVVITIVFSLIAYGLTVKYSDKFKTVTLKKYINSSLPLIEYTYDSGKSEYSIFSNLREGIYDISGLDTKDPLRMLASDNSLHAYFYNNYWDNAITPEEPDYPGTSEDPVVTKKPEETPAQTSASDPKETGQPAPATTPKSTPQSIPSDSNKYAKGTVTIRNGSNLDIDMDRIFKDPYVPKFADSKDGPQILIYHTHTTESYIKDLSEVNNNNYDSWSSDNSKTVVRVGHELDNLLSKQYGFNVLHNSTVHNNKYSESYNQSSITVRSVIKGNPTVKLSIDIHRDGLALGTGKLRVVENINGVDCAKIMFVVGTNETTQNDRWEDNLRLAVLLAETLEEIAPGIVRYISIRGSRYNQHIAENGLLIEFGGDGNTVDEVTASTKYLAEAINKVMN